MVGGEGVLRRENRRPVLTTNDITVKLSLSADLPLSLSVCLCLSWIVALKENAGKQVRKETQGEEERSEDEGESGG